MTWIRAKELNDLVCRSESRDREVTRLLADIQTERERRYEAERAQREAERKQQFAEFERDAAQAPTRVALAERHIIGFMQGIVGDQTEVARALDDILTVAHRRDEAGGARNG